VRPALRWLRRWGISFASLGGGILTLFVFRRGLPHVAWIIGYLLLLWLLWALITQMRSSPHPLVATAMDYTVQTLYHGLLLFVLPAYYAAATLTSVNVVFVALLVVLALLATFDPWYSVVVHPRPWLGAVFFMISIFAALNVALPLLGIRPFVGLLLSAWVAVVAVTPAVRGALASSWPSAALTTSVLGIAAAAAVSVACITIPPAPLFVARASLNWTVTSDSLGSVTQTITVAELRTRGLTAYTAIYAPAGLRQPVAHVWKQEGRIRDIVSFSAVAGGRREGYRTWSRKSAFPENPLGRWTVDVMTTSGQLIGRLAFRVVA
jgi:hypothetical protein